MPLINSGPLQNDIIQREHKVNRVSSYFPKGGHSATITELNMSLVVRKPVFGVSDQVRHNPGCTATEDV